LILFQTLVPISLYITVEICKLVQAAWIHWDLQMYYPERDQRAVPRSWNIADDLGQIEYIFSDKTGTLTRNVMEFRKCSIGGKAYGYLPKSSEESGQNGGQVNTNLVSREQFDAMEAKMIECLTQILSYKYVPPSQMSFVDPALFVDMLNLKREGKGQAENIINFFFSVIVCHTILIDKLGMTEEVLNESQTENASIENLSIENVVPHLLQYQAQSPDEAALVKAARDLGFVFLGRDQDYLNLSILGKLERVKILSVIEFNSTRKRMSVIIKKSDGKILLISKGADSVIYERLRIFDQSEKAKATIFEGEEIKLREISLKHLETFAESGLRTLCFAFRELSEDEYECFAFRHGQAATSMTNRELLMDAVADEYERELELLGSTAIEDRLQDGVPDTIANLQMAGIKIWVLTGDKLETAVNIGFSCKLLTKKMFLIMIKSDDATVEGTRKQLDEGFRKMSAASMNANYLDHLSEIDYEEAEEVENWMPSDSRPEYALIIDGTSLKHALEDRQCRPVFLDLATNCKAVLCCRVSPLQKAKCVELIKKTRNAMTLAIGDGANDVSMIQVRE
jgi:phospholipid-translocating ATPase